MCAAVNRFQEAIERFDAANREDPNREVFEGKPQPKELVYAQRMTHWLERLDPEAAEPLRLAVRCQHICRWTIPRRDYPMDRRGYLAWRSALAQFHAAKAGEILVEVGYDAATVARVQALLRKEQLRRDPEAQLLEDVACLVFLESQFSQFAGRYEAAKLLPIIRKIWKKMSPRGRQAALALDMPAADRSLIEEALKQVSG